MWYCKLGLAYSFVLITLKVRTKSFANACIYNGRGVLYRHTGALSKAIATVKERRKQMVSMRLDLENIEGMKKRAKVEGIPYQTLINSVLHRFLNGELVPKDSLKTAV